MRAFEIFLQKNKVSAEDWQKLTETIGKYETDFRLEIAFATNTVEFYLYSQKDLSFLANELGDFVLKPIDRQVPITKSNLHNFKKVRVKLSPKKTLLELKEQEEIQRHRVIEHLYIDVKKIIKVFIYNTTIILGDDRGNKLYSAFFGLSNPLTNCEFDFDKNIKIKKKALPLFVKIDETTSKLFTVNKEGGLLEIFGFPYFSHPVYFPLENFDFAKHSLIVGQTGVGKSKFIELFVKKLSENKLSNDYAVVIIDPHSLLYTQFLNLEQDKINFDFIRSVCDLFPAFSEPKIATELTILLFKTLLKEQFNAKMERVLKYTLYVLFLKNQMSLASLRKFLTEIEFRKEVLQNLGEENDYLAHFFETEFVELQTKFYEVAIMPVLVLVDELSFIPAFSHNSVTANLESILQNNFLTCFSLNRIFLGEKATRLTAGLIIQQLFLIAQKGGIKKKIILIIDEVSLVENESMINILSEARKFNLSLFLSQQYLTQITPELLKGILSNIYNYFVFKISDEDAKILVKNLDVVLPDEVLVKEKKKGFSDEDLKRNLLVTLNPRELLVRPFAEGKFYTAFKAKTLDV